MHPGVLLMHPGMLAKVPSEKMNVNVTIIS